MSDRDLTDFAQEEICPPCAKQYPYGAECWLHCNRGVALFWCYRKEAVDKQYDQRLRQQASDDGMRELVR